MSPSGAGVSTTWTLSDAIGILRRLLTSAWSLINSVCSPAPLWRSGGEAENPSLQSRLGLSGDGPRPGVHVVTSLERKILLGLLSFRKLHGFRSCVPGARAETSLYSCHFTEDLLAPGSSLLVSRAGSRFPLFQAPVGGGQLLQQPQETIWHLQT